MTIDKVWAEVVPSEPSDPSRAENDSLSSLGGKAAEYMEGYPYSHLALESYINTGTLYLFVFL